MALLLKVGRDDAVHDLEHRIEGTELIAARKVELLSVVIDSDVHLVAFCLPPRSETTKRSQSRQKERSRQER